MPNTLLHIENEMRRLEKGPSFGEKPKGIGIVRFLARCPVETSGVLVKVKTVLQILDEAALRGWPKDQRVELVLPDWFTSMCIPDMSEAEARQWLDWWQSLPLVDRSRVESEKEWSLSNWLYWMEPANRQWFWWDSKVLEEHDHIALAIEVEAWPFPWGGLRWLFYAAGASALEAED